MRFVSLVEPSDTDHHDEARWLLVGPNSVLLSDEGAWPGPALASKVAGEEAAHFLGRQEDVAVWCQPVDPVAEIPEGWSMVDLFSLHGRVSEPDWFLAGRAIQVVEWSRTHRFCGRCGVPTEQVPNDRAMRCPDCGLIVYPRLSPAVITLIHRDDEVLLARGRQFNVPMYSTLAGFVEPGESVEECLVREVREEVGVEVTDLDYRGSQPWPFPNSLMLGYWARWEGGDIVIQEEEIADARWFPVGDLPNIPPGLSIANKLITSYVASRTR